MQRDQVALDERSQFLVTATGFAPASTGAATWAGQSITIDSDQPALKTTDCVHIVKAPTPANAVRPVHARVTSATAITVDFCNPTAGALTFATGDYVFEVIRR